MSPVQLELVQSFPTSGARAVCYFSIGNNDFLAIPQLAEDIPNGPAGMNEGNSDVDLIIWRANEAGLFEEWQRLPVAGGEDAEFFTIQNRHFLATASIRAGKGPYNYNVSSVIFEFVEGKFVEFQKIPTFGAKQWRYFSINGRHFLALAQGVKVPGLLSDVPGDSTVFEWDGTSFRSLQTVPSAWGYNFLHFELSGIHYLAYADFREPSILMTWDGERFNHFQTFAPKGGRAFCFFQVEQDAYLALADIENNSILYKWTGRGFREHQTLAGSGGREFALIQENGETYVVLVRFILGTPKAPTTQLESTIYRMEDGFLKQEHSFLTHGATDAAAFSKAGETFLFVCESLTEDVRFRVDCSLYRFKQRPQRKILNEVRGGGKQSPEFVDLYTAYTASADGTGPKLTKLVSHSTTNDPLLVATSSEMIFYPGRGRKPSYINYRFNNRGFKELAAISHLGPALASLVKMATLDTRMWRTESEKLLSRISEVHKVNSVSLWRDELKVAAFTGREEAIASMIEYTCSLTVKFLKAVLEDPQRLNPSFLREEYLEATGTTLGATISMNAMMIATFFLVGLDISYRMRIWLQDQQIDWQRAMVLIVGKQGRETAGVTLSTNSVAQGIIQCSNLDLPVNRIYIAPHGPDIAPGASEARKLEQHEEAFRSLWNRIYATVGLGEIMFAGYPRYTPQLSCRPTVTETTTEVSEMPQIRGPDDWLTMTTRLRIVLEDPRQLLSGCVTDYAAEQLRQCDNDLQKVIIPGLDSYDYASASAALTNPRNEKRPSGRSAKSPLKQGDLFGTPWQRFIQFLAPPQKCPVAGGEIAFYEEGTGPQTNIWLHGLPLDSRSWAAQRSYFASQYRNVYVDLRGYGNSSKFPDRVQNVTQMNCDDLLSVLDHLHLGVVNLVGFASAGHVALRFARQHPERLRKLVVLNGSPCFRQRQDWPFGFEDKTLDKFTAAASRGGIEDLTNMVLDPAVVFKDLDATNAASLKACFADMSHNAGLDTVLKFFTDISFDDDRELMAQISTPTLLITGSVGEEVPNGTGAFLRRTIPNASLVEIPGADHFLFATKPDIVNPIIAGFLAA
ncbi:uncharacterized protein Z520_07300 [Fonsecaea multimorphosa CBS 102226]|uniref:AB hydrolase-1 domain-containing protein n=1 Tax=Fonsecaea multimorphosa CBS 102226 TaxID=1442371 RepID=A0A0D2IJE7_9EURO|nr:uncharacterized protein Z520_07300 [Fonsecaea multimorphosa CBS 102226]KIX97186.1 hypothetical protein Z520_07300 [Fonsecaea multimorphosa CBS 102226]OAL22962.1 hypothetical protein AYO22_06870 [Fonsecaea multimorphosa]